MDEKKLENLIEYSLEDLLDLTKRLNIPAFRAKQIFRWVHQKGVTSIDDMSDLSKELRNTLKSSVHIQHPDILNKSVSRTGDTAKFLLQFADQATVETVLMLYDKDTSRDRATVCVSTQVGCQMGCGFCATGISGLERNLTAGEIISQVMVAGKEVENGHSTPGITNVVFMGMGEPLANLPAVLKSIGILNSPDGQNIGMRRITISTCGLIPKIYQLTELKLPITLAVSLHGADNETRNQLMPVNRKYPIEDLVKACIDYAAATGRRVTYEYALFKGINDREKDAHGLGQLLKGTLCNINLIPANPVEEIGLERPAKTVVQKFARIVEGFGLSVAVREEKGIDINAACGQLRRRNLGK